MDHYRTFTPEEFATTPSFVTWVTESAAAGAKPAVNSSEAAQFWQHWIRQNPDCQASVDQARLLVMAVQQRFQDNLNETTVRADVAQLVERANQSLRAEETPVRPLVSFRSSGWWQVAAAVLLLLGIGSYWYSRQGVRPNDQPVAVVKTVIEKINPTSRPMTVLLNDGSVVTLEAKSRLSYPVSFTGATRTVQLVGEAFFDVAKNPAKPFLVYTDKTVTKVLGTSFRVRAFATDAVVRVMVRTGRVSVFTRTEYEQAGLDRAITGVLLLPNQLATIDPTASFIQKAAVDKPQLVAAPSAGPSEVTFDDQPVADVLRTLAKLYEVDIDFNEAALANCRITTSFAEETLSERLSSICQAIGATYRITTDRVDVSSDGCTP